MAKNINIPKTIHYVWLGKSEKSESIGKCITSWKQYMPDYEIKEWNEDNFNLEGACEYVRDAYDQKKWAFVSDYIRLYALWSEGGIYFDTDVEVLKRFDDLLQCKGFMCMENTYSVCTAVIGAERHAAWIEEIIETYDKRKFVVNGKNDMLPNTRFIFDILKDKYGLVYMDNVQTLSNGLRIYPKDYFSPLNSATGKLNITNNSYAIHHYDNSWISPLGKIKRALRMFVTRIIGEENKENLRNFLKK